MKVVSHVRTAAKADEGCAEVGFPTHALAGRNGTTGQWKEGVGQSDQDGSQDANKEANFILMVGVPLAIGGVSALAAGVDIASADRRTRTAHRKRVLPTSYSLCSDTALAGRSVTLKAGELALQSQFAGDGKAVFQVAPGSMEPGERVDADVYVEGAMIGRVSLEWVP